MSDTMIRIEGADALIKRLTTIQQMRHVKAAIKAAAIFLKGKIQKAPPVIRRRNMRLYGNSPEAARMRRGFFYHLKHGDIEVPYIRGQSRNSKKLSQSWTVDSANMGFAAIVGTSVSYAPLVQDRDEQASYHTQSGWVTVQGVRNIHGSRAIEFVEQALKREVEGQP